MLIWSKQEVTGGMQNSGISKTIKMEHSQLPINESRLACEWMAMLLFYYMSVKS
jgi:hypothetical protein